MTFKYSKTIILNNDVDDQGFVNTYEINAKKGKLSRCIFVKAIDDETLQFFYCGTLFKKAFNVKIDDIFDIKPDKQYHFSEFSNGFILYDHRNKSGRLCRYYISSLGGTQFNVGISLAVTLDGTIIVTDDIDAIAVKDGDVYEVTETDGSRVVVCFYQDDKNKLEWHIMILFNTENNKPDTMKEIRSLSCYHFVCGGKIEVNVK